MPTINNGNGRRVISGLNDSHMHLIRGGLDYNMELRWDGVPSRADATPAVGESGRRMDGVPVRRAPHADSG